LWGLWNGVGLYTQNQLSTYYKKNDPSGKSFWQRNKIFQGLSVIFTFMFISLGWVWFAMPHVPASITVFETLFGLN